MTAAGSGRARRQRTVGASSRGPSRRRRSWPQVAVLLGGGALSAAVGAGLGPRHAAKAGLSATTVVGLLLLAVGLVALATGVRALWRGLGGWSRLLVVPVALLLLVPMYGVALAVLYTQVPPTSLGERTPDDLGMAYAPVEFATADGVVLAGWLVPSRNRAAVVVMHGAGSTRSATLDQAAVLAEHGYGVLLVDARGHGESSGDGMDLGWYGDEDAAASVARLGEEPGVDAGRIGILGLSMGAEQAVGAAASTGVRAVVGEGATARTADDKDAWLPGGVSGAVQRVLDRVTFVLTDVLTPASPPRSLPDAVAAADGVPFLLIAAGEVPDEVRAAEVLRSVAPERVEVWEVPGAGHVGGLDVDPSGWEEQVTRFLDRHLLAE